VDWEANVRRSTRARHKPLEYWRGERIILGRAEDGPAPCPVFKGFLTFPKEIPIPLGSHKRKRRGKSIIHPPSSSKKGVDLMPPEAGWDDDTEPLGLTLEYATQNDVKRRTLFESLHSCLN
jgi:centromere protein C